MPDKPSAEVRIDEPLVRALLAQAEGFVTDAASVPLRKVAEGWDCEVWRVGDELAARLPRRAVAAPLIAHEQQVLPQIADAVEATGVRLPVPLVAGESAHGYPWRWSLVPWFAGTSGLRVPRSDREGWAGPLARALGALHVPAAADHPVNPMRGRPLADRAPAMVERFALVRTNPSLPADELDAAEDAWARGLAAAPWAAAPVWVHGDLHPGNLVAAGGSLRAIVDFGDVTGGDPAGDLAIAWLAFDACGRARFIAATEGRYSLADWTRAKAWAAAMAVLLLAHSDDEPAYGALGAESLHEVSSD